METDSQNGRGYGGGYRGSGGYGGGYRGRGGFGGPRPFRPAPVKVGEEFEVKIESMSKRGDAGVAKVEGLVIFVAGTKVGDSVKVKITKVGRGYATADIVSSSQSQESDTKQETEGAIEKENTSGESIEGSSADEDK